MMYYSLKEAEGGEVFEITSPLHLAANDGDKPRLQELFATGEYEVDAVDERGRTPLVRGMWDGDNIST